MNRSSTVTTHPVGIRAGTALIDADLAVPAPAQGVIVFVHGSGSSRFSRRNRAVASALQRAGFATLLLDLLTQHEEAEDAATGQHRFDIELLAGRVAAATDWLAHDPRTRALPIGYFGASTGAAAALIAAARRPERVQAIVSRGGRPDLAGNTIRDVRAPTLLIVGGADPVVLRLNRLVQSQLGGRSALTVVRGATHLFEEPGALDAVTAAATTWFLEHLKGSPVGQALDTGW
jgi:putative phosphoribosyl transferase